MTAKDPPAAPPLGQPIRLLVALSALSAVRHPPCPPSSETKGWYDPLAQKWLASVCKLIELDQNRLPPTIDPSSVRQSAADQTGDWSDEEISRITGILLEASLASTTESDPSHKGDKTDSQPQLAYTPLARAWIYTTLSNLHLVPGDLVPKAEKNLATTLFTALKAATEQEEVQKQKEVEKSRQAHSQGWGGSIGRTLATGAGVVAGGVIIGLTGGLAAPAIAALLAPLGIGGLLAGGAAPVVLGTMFGLGGGGLAGRRVRERWKGVEEFGFVEVGAGTRATKEEVEDLREARNRLKVKQEEEEKAKAKEDKAKGEESTEKGDAGIEAGRTETSEKAPALEVEEEGDTKTDEEAARASDDNRAELEERLLNLSLQAGTRSSVSGGASPRVSMDNNRPSLDNASGDEDVSEKKKPPSLTATIIVPGLLTVSKTEAITAWRAICSAETPLGGTHAPGYTPRIKPAQGEQEQAQEDSRVSEGTPLQQVAKDEKEEDTNQVVKTGLKDGRDVYLLRFESDRMLKTGRDIDLWVEKKIKGKLKAEIIKRTVLSAYFAAVKLPLTVYSMASMSLDNTWMQAQDRAKKAGRILGEVLEKRVQGERPVVLIGSSIGAYTVMEALLYLASLTEKGARGPVPNYVESAYFISLPSAPTPQEWAKCRSVVSRRVVNAWTSSDFVLAGVCRLHEVLSRAATLNSGISPAGLGPVDQPGVQDIDVSSVLRGHMELQAKMGEIIRIIEVDA